MDKQEKIYAVSVWKKLKYIYICGNIRAVSDSFEYVNPKIEFSILSRIVLFGPAIAA